MAQLTLIGAGLTGPLLGILLRRRRLPVDIYERRPDPRRSFAFEGRSINLALSVRGIHALEQAGIWEALRPFVVPMRGRLMHAVTGELTFQPYSRDPSQVIYSTSRAQLNMALLDQAESCGVRVTFDQRCIGYDFNTGELRLRDERTGAECAIHPEMVIATDGAGSAIRYEMLRSARFDYLQQYLPYGYKELTIPAGPNGEHRMRNDVLHIWPRGNFMLIALPNVDGTFGCILFLPFDGESSFAALNGSRQVHEFFETLFPDVVPLIPNLHEEFAGHPTGSMVTIKCAPWHVEGKCLLLGDAAHAIVPFFGQGLNCAFEDCVYLVDGIDQHGVEWEQVFEAFSSKRKIDTDAIADLALDNFIEMRDRVGDARFLMRKKLELLLEERYPDRFVPKYSMVTFQRVPYSVALERGVIQERILSKLTESLEEVQNVDWCEADRLIESELGPFV